MFSRLIPSFIKNLSTIFAAFAILISLTVVYNFTPIVMSLPDTYNPGLVLEEKDFHSLPLQFSSIEKIQRYFEIQGSILATYRIQIGLGLPGLGVDHPDNDLLLRTNTFPELPTYLQPKFTAGPVTGQTISAAEFIWMLSREDMGNGCHLNYKDLCVNNRELPMNPAFIIAFIQKENSLSYGPCSRPDADTNSACSLGKPGTFNSINTLQYRLDRAVGYMCRDIPRATSTNFNERAAAIARSCYDANDLYNGSPENPDWKYFKGFYKQLYYSIRLLRLRAEQCKIGGNYAFVTAGGQFQVGNTVSIQGQNIVLQNGITCAMYIYTPGSQLNFYNIFKSIKGAEDFTDVRGLPADFRPTKAFLPRKVTQ
jgi:hypothetical protein